MLWVSQRTERGGQKELFSFTHVAFLWYALMRKTDSLSLYRPPSNRARESRRRGEGEEMRGGKRRGEERRREQMEGEGRGGEKDE